MTANLERRTFMQPLEFREHGNSIVAIGLGIVYGKRSQNMGGYVETVRVGAARKTIQEQDIRALFNHDPNFLLGRRGAGTLRLEERDDGVHYEIDLPNTTAGRDVAELLRRGDLPGSSMGFRTISDEWGETEDGFPLRTLTELSVRDLGPVTFPAYTDSTAGLASLAEKRSLDLVEVRSLAEAGRLIEVIRNATAPSDDERRSDEGREVPTPIPVWRPSVFR